MDPVSASTTATEEEEVFKYHNYYNIDLPFGVYTAIKNPKMTIIIVSNVCLLVDMYFSVCMN